MNMIHTILILGGVDLFWMLKYCSNIYSSQILVVVIFSKFIKRHQEPFPVHDRVGNEIPVGKEIPYVKFSLIGKVFVVLFCQC